MWLGKQSDLMLANWPACRLKGVSVNPPWVRGKALHWMGSGMGTWKKCLGCIPFSQEEKQFSFSIHAWKTRRRSSTHENQSHIQDDWEVQYILDFPCTIVIHVFVFFFFVFFFFFRDDVADHIGTKTGKGLPGIQCVHWLINWLLI